MLSQIVRKLKKENRVRVALECETIQSVDTHTDGI
jgi:hypothetical protein